MPTGIYSRPPVEIRFWRLTEEGPVPAYAPHLGPCLIWRGTKDRDGYGRFTIGQGVQRPAHRIAVELSDGFAIPDGYQADHLCRVRSCVRRSHLELVTSRVNTLRGLSMAAVNASLTSCRRGHPFTPENTRIEHNGGGRACRVCITCKRARDAARATRRLNQIV